MYYYPIIDAIFYLSGVINEERNSTLIEKAITNHPNIAKEVELVLKPSLELERRIDSLVKMDSLRYDFYFQQDFSGFEGATAVSSAASTLLTYIGDFDKGCASFDDILSSRLNISRKHKIQLFCANPLVTKFNENDELHRIFLNEDEKGLLDFINRMNISVALKRKLISLYTNYEEHIRELFELLRPVVNAINENSDIYSETIHKLEQRINEATDLRSYVMECAGFQLPEADSYSVYISMLSPVSITVKESEDGAPDVIIGAFLKDITDLLYAGCDCNKIAARFKILSDETRLEILHCICARPCYGLELAEIFNITAPTV